MQCHAMPCHAVDTVRPLCAQRLTSRSSMTSATPAAAAGAPAVPELCEMWFVTMVCIVLDSVMSRSWLRANNTTRQRHDVHKTGRQTSHTATHHDTTIRQQSLPESCLEQVKRVRIAAVR